MRHGLVFDVRSWSITGLVSLLMASQVVYAQLDDPTRPPNTVGIVASSTDETNTTWDLSSILISPQRSVAIINGTAVQAGEMLAGAKVVQIKQTTVELSYRDEIIVLNLFPRAIKNVSEIKK